MAMVGGKVVVDMDTEKVTGDGLAWALFQAIRQMHKASYDSLAAIMQKMDEGSLQRRLQGKLSEEKYEEEIAQHKASRLGMVRGWAMEANVYGPTIVEYIKANAEVSLTGVVATVAPATSLGTTPTPNDPGAPIVGPTAPVALPVTGNGDAAVLGVT